MILKASLCVAAMCMVLTAGYASGYATNIALLDCACRWEKNEITVLVQNSEDRRYTDITVEAFREWQAKFPRLEYRILTNVTEAERWDMLVNVVEVLDSEMVVGSAETRAMHSTGNIEQVIIIVPVRYANGADAEDQEIPDTMFYNVMLHEIGHAIGLGHAAENEQGSVDPMFKYIDRDEEKRAVSKLDVMTLERLYRR